LQGLHPSNAGERFEPGRQRRGVPILTGKPTPIGLKRLRTVCSEQNIVLIFDEVFLAFRLAPGGAQEYFGVRADLVIYGKTHRRRASDRRRLRAQGADEALPRTTAPPTSALPAAPSIRILM